MSDHIRYLRDEPPDRYGRRGERKNVVDIQEGYRGERSPSPKAVVQPRKPPQGGSGTAPPQAKKK